jgi:hypothetical protein
MQKRPLLLAFLIIIILVLCSCGIDNTLSKEDIFLLVKNNTKLLDKAVDEMQKLDSNVNYISTTNKDKLNNSEDSNINGLYQSGMQSGKYITKQLKNDVLLSVIKLNGLNSIYIDDNKKYIEFSCGGSGFGPSTSYSGFYYSANGEQNSLNSYFLLCTENDLIPEGNGWIYKQKGGDNSYYTEKISANFFYYEASF